MPPAAATPSAHPPSIDAWTALRRSCLTLSRRNPLLALRLGRDALPLAAPLEAEALRALLVPGGVPLVGEGAGDTAEPGPRDACWRVALPEPACSHRLRLLVRRRMALARASGAGSLYLMVGAVHWRTEAPGPDAVAPLMLWPARLSPCPQGRGYRLQAGVGPAEHNLMLPELWAQQMGTAWPGPQGPVDAAADAVAMMIAELHAVCSALEGHGTWSALAALHVGVVDTTQAALWRDLRRCDDAQLRETTAQALVAGTRPPPAAPPRRGAVSYGAPLPEDASQHRAVGRVLAGESFVLQGPPGTGKSQTIANMVAGCVAQGRRVLFVSAKQAAADVVYGRLQQAGLAACALPLHAADTSAREALGALQQCAAAPSPNPEAVADGAPERGAQARAALHGYARAMHAPGPHGHTAYQAMNKVWAAPAGSTVMLDAARGACTTPAAYAARLALAHRLGRAWRALGRQAEHARWRHLAQRTACRAGREALAHATGALQQALIKVGHQRAAWGMPAAMTPASWRACGAWIDRAAGRLGAFRAPDAAGLEGVRAALAQAAACAAAWRRPWPASLPILQGAALPQALQLHAALVAAQAVVGAGHANTPLPVAQQGAWLQHYARRPARLGGAWLRGWRARATWGRRDAALGQKTQLQRFDAAVRALERLPVPAALAPAWRGVGTDAAWLGELLAALGYPRAVAAPLRALPQLDAPPPAWRTALRAAQCKQRLTASLQAWREAAACEPLLRDWAAAPVDALTQAHDELEALWSEATAFCEQPAVLWAAALARGAGLPEGMAGTQGPEAPAAGCDALDAALAAWAAARGEPAAPLFGRTLDDLANEAASLGGALGQWAALGHLQGVCDAAQAQGLGPLVDALARGTLAPEHTAAAFEAAYARAYLATHETQTPLLQHFVAGEMAAAVADLDAASQAQRQAAGATARRAWAAAQSQHPMPEATHHMLQRLLPMSRPKLTLRQLVADTLPAMQALAPCWLMSPLSVAQLLPMRAGLFDVVIFDEASMLPMSHALGAIVRGKQVVFVGDPKQMPPSERQTPYGPHAGEGDSTEAASQTHRAESVLEAALMAGWPMARLTCHYRSEDAALVAFSNARYYDSALTAFGHPRLQDSAVGVHHVADGLWVPARRDNPIEARALVAHLGDAIARGEKLGTVGIIAMSQAQAQCIGEQLNLACLARPMLARTLGADGPLKLLVTHLEAVQGDERDTIYLSVGYAPARPGGPLAHRFGPLNVAGGERRLNVALTRARAKLQVFTSIEAHALCDAKLRHQGAKDLKAFLQQVAGTQGPQEQARPGVPRGLDPLGEAIAQALEGRGWHIVTPAQSPHLTVDMAVGAAAVPDRLILGLLWDARAEDDGALQDEMVLRPAVHVRRGWAVHRVWAMHWWQHFDGALEGLHALLEARLAEVVAEARAAEERQRQTPPRLAIAAAPPALAQDVQAARHAAWVHHVEPLLRDGPKRLETLARLLARHAGGRSLDAAWLDEVREVAQAVGELRPEALGHAFYWYRGAPMTEILPYRRPKAGQPPRVLDDLCMAELSGCARTCQSDAAEGAHEVLLRMARLLRLDPLRDADKRRLQHAIRQATRAPGVHAPREAAS